MHSLLKSFLVGAVFCSIAFSPSMSKAETFFVEDQDNRFTVSFPDLWKKVGNQKPDDKLTVVGQGENNFAICRVRVREDRRFVIFPSKFDDAIQRTSFSREFWNNYLGEYNDVDVTYFKDEVGLGFGYASMVEASYETAEGAIVKKRGLMLASLYHDQLYVIDCSSEASVYGKWKPAFMGITKSIDFDKVINEHKNGHYRDFMDDPEVEVRGPKVFDTHKF